MFGVRISVRTLWKFRRKVSLSEMASTSVIFRVKQFKEDSVLNAVGDRATVFRSVGDYLRFYRSHKQQEFRLPSLTPSWYGSVQQRLKLSAPVNGIMLSAVISTALQLQSDVHCHSTAET